MKLLTILSFMILYTIMYIIYIINCNNELEQRQLSQEINKINKRIEELNYKISHPFDTVYKKFMTIKEEFS